MPVFDKNALLIPQQVSQREWKTNLGDAAFRFVPFTEIGSEPYTTYLKIS